MGARYVSDPHREALRSVAPTPRAFGADASKSAIRICTQGPPHSVAGFGLSLLSR